jgi:hypothetical protein
VTAEGWASEAWYLLPDINSVISTNSDMHNDIQYYNFYGFRVFSGKVLGTFW